MKLKRRNFLLFLAESGVAVALAMPTRGKKSPMQFTNPKANSQLLQNGTLYAAKLNCDGSGSWIRLKANTPINSDLPSYIERNLLRLSKGKEFPTGGDFEATSNRQIQLFKQQYKNLGDLYLSNDEEKQGAILIDARYAANAIRASTASEDTEIALDGSLYISFSSGAKGKEGGQTSSKLALFLSAPTGPIKAIMLHLNPVWLLFQRYRQSV